MLLLHRMQFAALRTRSTKLTRVNRSRFSFLSFFPFFFIKHSLTSKSISKFSEYGYVRSSLSLSLSLSSSCPIVRNNKHKMFFFITYKQTMWSNRIDISARERMPKRAVKLRTLVFNRVFSKINSHVFVISHNALDTRVKYSTNNKRLNIPIINKVKRSLLRKFK